MTKKMEIRLPDDLAAEVDQRVATVNEGDTQQLSRNEWMVRALRWACSQPVSSQVVRLKI